MKKSGLGTGLEKLFSVFDEVEEIDRVQKVEARRDISDILTETIVPRETLINRQGYKTKDIRTKDAGDKEIKNAKENSVYAGGAESVSRETILRGVSEIDIRLIDPNPNQPRKDFNAEALEELAESVKLHGIIQPIVLNKSGNRYMIIAGERRFRAAKLADLTVVPAIIKEYTPKQVKEISIIENLQREDLNPIEAARAIKELMKEYKLTQEEVADRLGKSRAGIANLIRLLNLHPNVIKLVEEGKLSAGHARTLVVIGNEALQQKVAIDASNGKLSVRELERFVQNIINPPKKEEKAKGEQSIELRELVNDLKRVFGTKVSVLGNDSKGRISIDYYTRDDLDRINDIISKIKN